MMEFYKTRIGTRDFFEALTKFKDGLEPLWETTAVLVYEVGKLMEQAMYAKWAKEQNKGEVYQARIGWYKSEVMDAIAQLVLICEALGINFEEYKQMGMEKALERFTGKEIKE